MSNAMKIGGLIAVIIALAASGFAIGYVVGNNNAQASIGSAYYPGSLVGSYGGMMGRTGPGGMNPGAARGSAQFPRVGEALTLEEAIEVAEAYIEEYGDGKLELDEVMQFDNHFYAHAREVETGINAFEVLIDPYTGEVFPEPGPNMMWNAKYGMMGSEAGFRGGMMGWRGGMMGGYITADPADEMSVTPNAALEFAQAALDSSLPGTVVDEEVSQFYGYYTIHILHDGATVGMLSVNGYSGQVWIHDWHGEFIDMTGHEDE